MKRVLMLLVAAVAALLLGAAPASAAPYPPVTPNVTTNAGSYVPGASVIITANGFGTCVGGVVTFTITPPGGGTPIAATAPANASGVSTVTITAGTAVGVYNVVASCGSLTANTTFTVRLIPATGSSIDLPLQAAAVLVLVGAGLVVVAMRRRRHTTTVIA